MAYNAHNPLLPQPDFHLIGHHHQALAGEMVKIPNLPQFETGNAILRELQQINQRLDATNLKLDTAVQEINHRLDATNLRLDATNVKLDTAVQEINHRLDTTNLRLDATNVKLDTAVQEIKVTIETSDRNNNARLANSQLTVFTEALTPLINPTENTPITGFPLTPGDIGRMQTGTLHAVMKELGLVVEGQRVAKEQRLRVCIGLSRSPAA